MPILSSCLLLCQSSFLHLYLSVTAPYPDARDQQKEQRQQFQCKKWLCCSSSEPDKQIAFLQLGVTSTAKLCWASSISHWDVLTFDGFFRDLSWLKFNNHKYKYCQISTPVPRFKDLYQNFELQTIKSLDLSFLFSITINSVLTPILEMTNSSCSYFPKLHPEEENLSFMINSNEKM